MCRALDLRFLSPKRQMGMRYLDMKNKPCFSECLVQPSNSLLR